MDFVSAELQYVRLGAQTSSQPGTFCDDELAVCGGAWSQPGALSSMLDQGRALSSLLHSTAARIEVLTIIIWGDRDSALDASLAEHSASLCDSADAHHFVDATHWIHHKDPESVNDRSSRFRSMRRVVTGRCRLSRGRTVLSACPRCKTASPDCANADCSKIKRIWIRSC